MEQSKNKTYKNFNELYKEGIVDKEDIDDYIDLWHNSNSEKELYEFLGLTKKEYIKWVEINKL